MYDKGNVGWYVLLKKQSVFLSINVNIPMKSFKGFFLSKSTNYVIHNVMAWDMTSNVWQLR